MAKSEWLFGMTTLGEQVYFEEYAASIYSGVGAVVDLGCWLGSTTIPLARGLSKNPSAQAQSASIHAYDRFLWEEWMRIDGVAPGTALDKYKAGDSFLNEFRKRTAPWADRIQVHAGDLCEIGWTGGSIEFLLIDAMKSWDLANAILRRFFPFLIPNKSYVLHQDFAHYYESWIHLIHYRLRDFFRLVHIVPGGGSFVFEYVKQIPDKLFTTSYDASLFSDEEVDLAFDHSMNLATDAETQAAIAASKVMHFIHLRDTAKARIELAKVVSRGFPLVRDLQIVQAELK